ncbi:alpha-glucuronidase family glycosyl hydrolase [Kribbella sp. WER1]
MTITRRTLLASGAAGALAAGFLPGLPAFAASADEDGYDLWLRYRLVPDAGLLARYRSAFTHIVVSGNHAVLRSAGAELSRGLSALLGRSVPVKDIAGKNAVVVSVGKPAAESFTIKRRADRLEITGGDERGALYGAFRFLQQLQRQRPVSALNLADRPAAPLRMLNHWDNLNGSIERGYAGKSIFAWDELPGLRERYVDYARAIASVGINNTVVNNVNASADFLRSERLPGLAALAGVLRQWGVRLWLSANYAAPITLSGGQVTVADPFDPGVQQWWQDKIDEIYRLIPDFGGFLVKANSEGQPGPLDYGRTHADGANMLADRIAPYGGRLVWRSFVHEGFSDWAQYEYNVFHPLDGKFHENAIVQTKNGPIDFQVREPVNPLFGGLPQTNQMVELEITQEYTGHATHLCYLVPEWKSILGFRNGPTVADIVTGVAYRQENVGLAGVLNFGDDRDWTGYQLGAANTHGFARLAWNPGLSADEIVTEWIELTFGSDPQVKSVLKAIMLQSWETYESYTSPLGMGYLTYPLGAHFLPDPNSTHNLSHYTTNEGTGFDRTAVFPGLYTGSWPDVYGSLDKCPDELLLFMHWVPYTHRLKSGKTVIQHIYDSHFAGYERVLEFRRAWGRLAGRVDAARHADIAATFDAHVVEAERWRDTIVSYFYGYSRILSTGTEWLQVEYPNRGLLIGGVANDLPLAVTNAFRTAQTVAASVRPVDSSWTVGTTTVAIESGASASITVPVTPPLVTEMVELAIETGQTALGAEHQTFVVTPDAAQCRLALDIGTVDSPLVPGYARVSPSTTWDAARGYGWVGTAPQPRDRGSAWDALRRDFVGDYPARTFRITLPPGKVRLSALVGDGGPDCPPTLITEAGKLLAASTDLPGGVFTWIHADLDGGATGRTADLVLDSEPDRFWHLGALILR